LTIAVKRGYDGRRMDEPAGRTLEAARREARRRDLLHPLQRAAQRVREEIRAGLRARGHRLRPAHAAVIVHLEVAGTRLTELAGRTGVTKQALGKLVDELEAIGYLERRPDPADGRAKIVCFSRTGERLLHDAREVVERLWQEYAALLGETRLRRLRADLELLAARPPGIARVARARGRSGAGAGRRRPGARARATRCTTSRSSAPTPRARRAGSSSRRWRCCSTPCAGRWPRPGSPSPTSTAST
jgi:DNA-binding MarR family transcriptional regulator